MFCCTNDESNLIDNYQHLEKHRQIALSKWKEDNSSIDFKYSSFNGDYQIPDSLQLDSLKIHYIKKNDYLPGYIKEAIINEHESVLMTLGEFFLVKKDEIDSLMIIPVYLNPKEAFKPYIIHVGYRKNFSKRIGTFGSGKIWTFKYGFLWSYGLI